MERLHFCDGSIFRSDIENVFDKVQCFIDQTTAAARDQDHTVHTTLETRIPFSNIVGKVFCVSKLPSLKGWISKIIRDTQL